MGMSVAEYELQKTTGRFRVLDIGDARALSVPGVECHDDDGHSLLVEFIDDKPVRIVGWDGGSPEDQCLTRDWSWVAVELNAQAELTEAERRFLDACYEVEEFERTHTVIRFDGGTAYDQARAIERRCADAWQRLLALRAKEKADG